MEERKLYTFDRVIRILFGVISVMGVLYLIYLLRGALLPFLVAWIIAYLLNPLVEYNRQIFRLKGRTLAISLTIVEVLITLALLGFLFLPSVIQEISRMRELLSEYVYSGNIPFLPDAAHDFIRQNINFGQISELFSQEQWSSIAQNTLGQTWGFITGSIGSVLKMASWLIVFLYIVFILQDYDRILRGFERLIPLRYRETTLSIANDVKEGMNRYFRGQTAVACIVGILFSIGFLIVGIPLAIVLGLFIGLLNMVPYMQLVGIIPTALLCLISASDTGENFWLLFGACMLVFIIVQIIEDAVIVPRIMGKVTGLNPAIILLSLSIWGSLLGVVGMIIALPLTSLCLSYYQRYIIKSDEPVFGNVPDESEATESPKSEIEESKE